MCFILLIFKINIYTHLSLFSPLAVPSYCFGQKKGTSDFLSRSHTVFEKLVFFDTLNPRPCVARPRVLFCCLFFVQLACHFRLYLGIVGKHGFDLLIPDFAVDIVFGQLYNQR